MNIAFLVIAIWLTTAILYLCWQFFDQLLNEEDD